VKRLHAISSSQIVCDGSAAILSLRGLVNRCIKGAVGCPTNSFFPQVQAAAAVLRPGLSFQLFDDRLICARPELDSLQGLLSTTLRVFWVAAKREIGPRMPFFQSPP
jgi:hypothetical protein